MQSLVLSNSVPPYIDFSKKEDCRTIYKRKMEKRLDITMIQIVIIRGTELDKIQYENGALIHHRNVDG